MSTLRKDLRNDLEKAIIKARDIAEGAATAALQALAVDQSKPFPHMDAAARALRNRLRERGRAAGDLRNDFTTAQSINHLAQLVGYEHWHRMIFARFLAENGLLLEPEHQVALSLEDVKELAQEEKRDLWDLAGSYAQRMLPEVFRTDDAALEVTLAREDRAKLEKLLADLDPAVFTASDSLGWTYQFWQTKRKKEVNDSGVKIGADEISPVTQLFTEDYMVDFLLDNTLGAWWAGKVLAANPIVAASAQSEDELRQACALSNCEWKYIRFIKTEHGQWTPAAGTFDGWPKSAKELKCLDPCCGSGHFIGGMFERVVALRMAEEGLEETSAIQSAVRDNLFGLELDPRCTQIAAFSLALAAWRRVGHCLLPPMNIACSGLAPNTPVEDWVALAGDNPRLKFGMQTLHRLFAQAPVLGSLINPNTAEGAGYSFSFHELQPLLEKALAQETGDDTAHETTVTAKGVAKAAEILAGQFTLVATNVPYLGRGKHPTRNNPNDPEELGDYCERVHTEAKADLATCFVERCLTFSNHGGSTALVTPQNWLFLGQYEKFRESLLTTVGWKAVVRLGARAFETITGEVVNVALLVHTRQMPTALESFLGLDVSEKVDATTKQESLLAEPAVLVNQLSQLKNPDARIIQREGGTDLQLLSERAVAYQGLVTGDRNSYIFQFWEIPKFNVDWETFADGYSGEGKILGRENIIFWERSKGRLYRMAAENRDRLHDMHESGNLCWNKKGVLLTRIGLRATPYYGERFDNNLICVLPLSEMDLPALWNFCASAEYQIAVRELDQKLSLTNATACKVGVKLEDWFGSNGFPKAFSSDPTQWLFNGHPAGSDQPLHVAVARLLGYRWPRQTGSSFPDCPALDPDGLEPFCDKDGIVCLTPLRGEAKAAERLRKLLDAAHPETGWNERQLLTAAAAKATNLEDWLRDEFFEQHCKLFQHRPFLWHIWDGRPDGFHSLVNYHQLAAPDGAGHKLLETLTYAYLGDWIRRQKDDAANGVPGAEDRHIAAEILQKELIKILAGEPPYDLFVRWKPLHQQPIGWHPNLNDGVRLNIRPFLLAKDVKKKDTGILRWKPNVKWTKDRGTEPQREKSDYPWFWTWDEKTEDFKGAAKFDGNRWNDLHYTTAAKQAARERKEGQP